MLALWKLFLQIIEEKPAFIWLNIQWCYPRKAFVRPDHFIERTTLPTTLGIVSDDRTTQTVLQHVFILYFVNLHLLFQLVSKLTTQHNHILLYWQLWYIVTNDIRLEIDGHMTKLMYETCDLTIYTMSIHLIWYRQELVNYNLISVHVYILYISSLKHVSHHHIICTHYHFLVAPFATYHVGNEANFPISFSRHENGPCCLCVISNCNVCFY